MSAVDLQLNRFLKFGKVSANAREVQIYIEGTSFIPPSQADIKQVFANAGWNVLDVSVISPVTSYFRAAKVTITAIVQKNYSDTQVILNARSLMNQFLTVGQVSIVKGKLTPKQILGNDDLLNNIGWGIGLTTGTAIALAVLGLVIYKKVL